MSTDAQKGPRYTLHDGFRMPMGFPVAGFESGQRYPAEAGDLFVAMDESRDLLHNTAD